MVKSEVGHPSPRTDDNDKDFLLLYFKRQNEFIKVLNTLVPSISEDETKAIVQQALTLSQSYLTRVEALAARAGATPSVAYESERNRSIRALSTKIENGKNTARDTGLG